ncbi:hypothetical protein H8E77_30260 [bacterium]|nr:hypothetical protein [bacterium]
MNDKRNEWERRLLKVLLPIIESEKEVTLEELMDKDYPGEENQLLADLHELESYGTIQISKKGGYFVRKSVPEIIDEFICSVIHTEGDIACLRLRGETDGELRDFGLEYPLHELRAQIGEVSVGMMLKCQVQDNLRDITLHFKQFTPQKLPLERRKAIQEEYNKMFEDFDEEEPLEIAETT